MRKSNTNQTQNCSTFSYLVQTLYTLVIFIGIMGQTSFAFDSDSELEAQLALAYQTNNAAAYRSPASFVPNDEVEPVPFEQKIWLQNVLVEDEAGVLKSIRADLERWQEIENYAAIWDIKSTGLYETPNNVAIRNYLGKKMLRYFDKRLMNNVKKAEEGSALHSVGQVHTALRPNTKVSIGNKVKIKVKARVLQGNADIIVDNPYVEYKTSLSYEGSVNMDMKKDIKLLGLQARVNYQVDQNVWSASFDRKLTKRITARVSSHQSDKDMAFENSSNKVVELFYNRSF